MKRVRKALGLGALVFAAGTLCVIAAESRSVYGAYAIGGTSIELLKDGHHVVSTGGRVSVIGKFVVSGERVTFRDFAGPMKCPSGQAGIYSFKATASGIDFTLVSDRCEGRAQGITSATWLRYGD